MSSPTPTPAKPAKAAPKTKASIVSRLLGREKGATLAEIMKATGWQAHSCRAFLTGLRKRSYTITHEDRGDGKTAYRMAVCVPSSANGATDTASE